jgi:hypothetical protein
MEHFVRVLGFVGIIFGFLLLFTRGPFGRWIDDRVDRREPRRLKDPIYALLRREIEQVGNELEALPYERLLECADTTYRSAVIDGVEVCFDTEVVSVAKNGALHVCVDARAMAPDWKWQDVLPSYNFRKRKDGSVYR